MSATDVTEPDVTKQIDLVRVTPDVIDVAEHLAAVDDSRCGAVTTFIGQVRDHDPEVPGTVASISYSAHPDAQTVLARIVAELSEPADSPGADGLGGADGRATEPDTAVRVAASHRIGDLAVGDLALVVCVATAHRARSYEISREIVERIKVELPVWKKQYAAAGTSHWSGL